LSVLSLVVTTVSGLLVSVLVDVLVLPSPSVVDV